VDSEISLMLKRVARGVEFSEANLGLDEIRNVGPGGMFIDADSTIERMRITAFLPEIADRASRTTWTDKRSLETADRALIKARQILEMDCPSLFSPEADARIRQRFKGMVAGDFKLPEGWRRPGCATVDHEINAAAKKIEKAVAA
jgi:trimethylamine---corrinoid protein Co-methyltransferase